MVDQRGALLELGDELGDVVRHRDRLGEPLLLRARGCELGLESSGIGLVLRQLRRDLGADLGKHRLQHAFAQYVLLQVLDQRRFHLGHRLVDLDVADRAAALVMFRAAVAEHAHVRAPICLDARRRDRAAAGAALRDPGERVLRCGALRARTARRELRVDREPRGVVHDPPFRDVDREHLRWIRLHTHDAARLTHLLDAAVDVHAAVARVEQDRSDR
ncbi:MAG TPA: hypothetical protein VMJ10_28950 [Kofleriaceae bacterium]|nr:hypothetical protein [Kofleriaceae bacterium]